VTANELVQAGAKVVLVDFQTFPRPKPCGGGVLTRALNQLPAQAASAVQRRCDALEINFYSPKLTFRTRRKEAFANIVTRDALDAALLDAVVKQGVETRVRQGMALRGFTQTSEGLELDVAGEKLQARLLVGADGVDGPCAGLAGFPALPQKLLGITAELSAPATTPERYAQTIRFDFDVIPNGYGWVFPLQDRLSVGIMAGQADESKLRAALRDFCGRLDLSGVSLANARVGSIAVEPRPGALARGRVLLVGDAAGFADPLTGEGLYFGALSGRLAAKAIIEGDYKPEAVAAAYQRGLEASVLPELRLGRSVAKLFYGYPRLRNMLFRFAGQTLCDVITEVALGEHSYGDYLGHGAASLSVPQLFKKLVTTYEEDAKRR
jgi:geranylgeranyl reductase family protein